MTYRTDVDTVVEPAAPAAPLAQAPVAASHTTEVRTYRPNPLVTVERAIVFVFGLIVGLIGLRIVLLLLAARQGNDLVAAIYNLSEVFVAPFRGILRIDEVQSGATALDVGAIVAIVGILIIELVVIGVIRLFRPSATA
jgi:YGGT family protein